MQPLLVSLLLLTSAGLSAGAPWAELTFNMLSNSPLDITRSAVPDDAPAIFDDDFLDFVSAGAEVNQYPDDVRAYLHAHNTYRAKHGARALTWDFELQHKAQEWANRCQLRHSRGLLGQYGENVAAGTGSAYDEHAALMSWTEESDGYSSDSPEPSHFTQVVWKATEKVGCAVAECEGLFPSKYGKARLHVCEYYPAGNVIGSFPNNVQPSEQLN